MHTYYSPFKAILSILLFIGGVSIFQSCLKEQNLLETPSIPIDDKTPFAPLIPNELISTSVFGQVMNEYDEPVSSIDISLRTIHGFIYTTTDRFGNFSFPKVMVAKNGALLKVWRGSSFHDFRNLSLTKNAYNFTKVKLLNIKLLGEISSNEGGTLEDASNGAKLELSPNSVRDEESGEDYNGNVRVQMTWVDPTAEDLSARMVGDLSGIDQNGQLMALGTYGMLSVQMRGENWELLQIKEGMTAQLSFPIPSEMLSQALQSFLFGIMTKHGVSG